MSYEMVLPQFSMDLNCPTSTSKTLEIAEIFSGDNGIVIQLNGSYQYTFCTSFISNYSSEDEWLFSNTIGIQIESVIIQNTSQNFKQIFHVLYCFHQMIKGRRMSVYNPSHNDYLILNDLIKYKLLINNKFKHKYPKYIHNTYHSFTNNITKIELNLFQINNKYKQLKNLILYSSNNTKETNKWNKNNVMKRIIFKLFTNIKET
eukprot:733741_1